MVMAPALTQEYGIILTSNRILKKVVVLGYKYGKYNDVIEQMAHLVNIQSLCH